ncbi:site-specific recombinase XerD [Lacibacter cauensis]|uniref:Site-specific recombinase XerD n=1 Tax=Lacibacter cauensis TaxID=510947 RepID=A0A562SHU9_9BACT|nr:site-specific integrase [Lacibacter cauensis]TWI80514.1 site-specific recombinase XerD [Lacibacter cauensis]
MNYRFHLRSNRTNKKGLANLSIIIRAENPIWIGTGISMPAIYWNQEEQELTRFADPVTRIKFTEVRYNADRYFQLIAFENRPFNAQDFLTAVIKSDIDAVNNPLLSALFDRYINEKNVGYARSQHYITIKKELQKLNRDLRVKQITFDWGNKIYKYYLDKSADNTATGKMKMIKAVIHYAMDLGYIKEDPLRPVKLKSFEGKIVFLNLQELQELQELYDVATLPDHQNNVLRHFLFSCYTGLRRSDIRNFKDHVVQNNCLYLTTLKTKEHIIIPLSDPAKKLMDKPFNNFTGEYINRELQKIIANTGIKKNVTMHVGRHTFATISLRLGMQLKVLSKILGHSNVKQTEKYVHLVEDHLQEQMNVWNNLKVVHRAAAV